jgi:hypothetical protein
MFQGFQDRRTVRRALKRLKGTRLDDIVREMRSDNVMSYDGIRLIMRMGVWSVDLAQSPHRLSGWMADIYAYCVQTMWVPDANADGSHHEEAHIATMRLQGRTGYLIARVLNQRAHYWRRRER